MADDGATIRITAELTQKLEAAAQAAGESLDQFIRRELEAIAEREAELDELERIVDETIQNGDGIPLEEIEPWLRGWGKPDGPKRPR
jgi:predicted transcriptional regulator